MDSLKFTEDSAIIDYQPIKSEEHILIEKKSFNLGEYFLKSEISEKPLREKNYRLSTGFFKKYLDQSIKKNPMNSKKDNKDKKFIPPSRKAAVLLFKAQNAKKFNKAVGEK